MVLQLNKILQLFLRNVFYVLLLLKVLTNLSLFGFIIFIGVLACRLIAVVRFGRVGCLNS